MMSESNIIIENGVLKQYIPNESETEIIIPSNVKEIGDNAFLERVSYNGIYCVRRNDTLKSIIIPNSVTSIGHMAFRACTYLESIIIPDSVTEIGINAFMSCTSLKIITIKDKQYNCKYFDGDLFLIHCEHKTNDYTVYNGEIFERIENGKVKSTKTYAVEFGTYQAYGKNIKEAIKQLELKIVSEKTPK